MKIKATRRVIGLTLALLSILNLDLTTGVAQTSAFTYQGRLDDGGVPANGRYDFIVTDFDAPTGGSSTAFNLVTNIGVTNGLFTLPLDLGALTFPGADRWLELGVRTNGGGAFTFLSPRQRVTSAPYAIRAASAGQVAASGITGTLAPAQLPAAVVTNAATGVNLTGTFTGNGAGLTNLPAWQLGGNAGTTPGMNFLGTTDNQPFEVRVNNQRALRLEPNAGGAPNIIAGAPVNFAGAGVQGATIGGGGATNVFGQAFTNRVLANLGTVGGGADNAADGIFATVGGGRANNAGGIAALVAGGWYNSASGGSATVGGGENNTATGGAATVTGGNQNTASGDYAIAGGSYNTASGLAATVGGGSQNTASALSSTVAGGGSNQATNNYAAIGGGYGNLALGDSAIVPGGLFNQASGATSFAAGRRAKALHGGAFNWADAQDADFYSTTSNQFNVRASGGARFETSGAGLTVDGQPVLAGANGGALTNLNASQLTGGTVPAAALSNAWKIGGNTGTSPATNFLGTADNQPLELRANNQRVLQLTTLPDPVQGGNTVNVLAGNANNVISNGVVGGLIAGGGTAAQPNRVGADYASVLGGANNVASGTYSVAMGVGTKAAGDRSTAMGSFTTASGDFSTALGEGTLAFGPYTTAMGRGTIAVDPGATALGQFTVAGGVSSLAAGFYAQAFHPGSYVWADATTTDFFTSTGPHQYLIRAAGGVAINTNNPAGAALAVNGQVRASSFAGNGAGLTNLSAWALGGNAGTTPASQFIGTIDNQSLEVRVNNARALRLEPNATSPNLIGGYSGNSVAAGLNAAIIAGGGRAGFENRLGAELTFIGSGWANTNNGGGGVLGGGFLNRIETGAFDTLLGSGRENVIHANAAQATLAGGLRNVISNSASYATVGGGQYNRAGAFEATVAGGGYNWALANAATIGGGGGSSASGQWSTISGGRQIFIGTADYAAIGGGWDNQIANNAAYATIGGGRNNTTGNGATYATIPGGQDNHAAFSYSFAAGRRAKANHQGAFVWGDSTDADIASTAANSVTLRAAGGYRLFSNAGATAGVSLSAGGTSWATISDRNVKKDFAPVDSVEVLEKLVALPITQWRYDWENTEATPHIGPMAQDFKAAFYPGADDKVITTLEADGVALAAIQGLNQKVESREQKTEMEMAELRAENAALKARLEKLEQLLTQKLNRN